MAREHIRAFADVPGVTVCGIHSRTRDRAEKLAAELGVPHVCASIADLHATTRADLVVVAVPELAARRVAEDCFAHPWIVLLEKPAGYDLADAEAITRAAEAKRSSVLVALNRRFLSSTRAAAEDLDRQPGPRFIHVQDQQSLDVARSIGHPPEVVRNWMFANSIHLVDYFFAFGRGEVVSVRHVFPYRPEAPVVVAAVEFAGGDRGLYEGIWSGPGPWAVTVTTAVRRWEMRPLEQASFQSAGERRLQQVDVAAWDRAFKPGFRLQAEEIVRAVRGEPSRAVTLQQANRTMRLIQAVFGPTGAAESPTLSAAAQIHTPKKGTAAPLPARKVAG
jgi:predicted dehydrogenase